MTTRLVALVAVVLGLVAGERFPDIDQRTDLLLHRSILTHGLLAPIMLYAIVHRINAAPARWFVMGVCLGVAVHLAFDLFPRGWQGYALVSLPVYGWLPAPLSIGWIAVSGAVCLYLGARLTKGWLEAVVFLVGIVGVFAYAAPGEHALWRPLASVVVATVLAGSVAVLVKSRSAD